MIIPTKEPLQLALAVQLVNDSGTSSPECLVLSLTKPFIADLARCFDALDALQDASSIPEIRISFEAPSAYFHGVPFDEQLQLLEGREHGLRPGAPVLALSVEPQPWDGPVGVLGDEGEEEGDDAFEVSSMWLTVDRQTFQVTAWDGRSDAELHSKVEFSEVPGLKEAIQAARTKSSTAPEETDVMIQDALGEPAQAHEQGYRDALQSMLLALRHAGVAEAQLKQAVTESLDALANNQDKLAQPLLILVDHPEWDAMEVLAPAGLAHEAAMERLSQTLVAAGQEGRASDKDELRRAMEEAGFASPDVAVIDAGWASEVARPAPGRN